jgi:O-antigen ligase
MNYLERVYSWLLLAPIVLPVIIWSGVIYPYLVPKTLLFYALSLSTVGAFLILLAHGKPFYWNRLTRWEMWIPGLLLGVAYLTSLFGIDFYRSFWSLFVRGDGLLMLTCIVSSFYLMVLSADQKFFDRLLAGTALVATFVAVYGIGESIFLGGRIGSLLGNAAFFAGYLGISVFATLAVARRLHGWLRRGAYLGAVLQVVAIVLTATRGTILALVVASGCLLVYAVYALRGTWRLRASVVLMALVAAGGLFFAFRSELAHVPFAPVARLASISVVDPDVASRLFIWKNMIGEVEKSPWIGVGAEHVDVLFNRFYDPTQISEQWFDRSHNAFLDYLAQYGIGGLLLYLALIAAFFSVSVRLRRSGQESSAVIVALLAVTYAVQNFFVFDTVSSFWLLLALLACFYAASKGDASLTTLQVPPWARPASWVIALGLVLLIIPISVRPFMAAYDLAHAYTYQLTDVSKEATYLARGFSYRTYGDVEYGYEAYDLYGNTQATRLTGQARVDAYHAALPVLTANFYQYPYDARTALYLAHVLSLAPDGVSVDQNLLVGALERAIRLSPKRSQPWYILTNISITNANRYPIGSAERKQGYAAAHDLLTRYIALVPTLPAPRFVVAQLEYASGDTAAAAASAAIGKENYRGDSDSAQRAAGYYENVHDWKNAQFFLSEIVRMNPTDDLSRYDLAKVMYLAGDPVGAALIVADLRMRNPTLLSTDPEFLAALTVYEQSTK